MEAQAVHAHWTDWATKYGTNLRATTLTSTIKRLEIDALRRAIERVVVPYASILEVGCGNGHNIVALAKIFKRYACSWDGIDYVPEMAAAAQERADRAGLTGCCFMQADIRDAHAWVGLQKYQSIFTDRLLINLATVHEQCAAVNALGGHLADGGALILIENSRQGKDRQNDLREALGMPRRPDAPFNLFLDDDVIIPHLKSLFKTVEIQDFAGLHDLLLYVLNPYAQGWTTKVDYESPLVAAATEMLLRNPIDIGPIGQNRMYFCQ